MIKYGLLFLLLSILSGCSDSVGVDSSASPEDVAVAFTQAIYEDDSLENALKMSSDTLAKNIKRFHTNRSVQKGIFNQLYDTVKIEAEPDNRVGRKQYAKQASVVLLLKGQFDFTTVVQIKRIELIRNNDGWKVHRITDQAF